MTSKCNDVRWAFLAAVAPVSLCVGSFHLITRNVGMLFIRNNVSMMRTPCLTDGKVIRELTRDMIVIIIWPDRVGSSNLRCKCHPYDFARGLSCVHRGAS